MSITRYSRAISSLPATAVKMLPTQPWVPPGYVRAGLQLHSQLGDWRYGYGLVFYARWLAVPGMLVYTNTWGLRMRVTHQNWWLGERSDYG